MLNECFTAATRLPIVTEPAQSWWQSDAEGGGKRKGLLPQRSSSNPHRPKTVHGCVTQMKPSATAIRRHEA